MQAVTLNSRKRAPVRWPQLANKLPRYFDILADYNEVDYRRLIDRVAWIDKNPACTLYPGQLPVSGLGSKWLEKPKGLLAGLVDAERGECRGGGNSRSDRACASRHVGYGLRRSALPEESGCRRAGMAGLSGCVSLAFPGDDGLAGSEPESQAFLQQFIPGHVVRPVAGKVQADHSIVNVE